jgi:EAL domain-containing protein (putative c-di-GMP-specific phosphodiesterase class I)
VPLASRAERSSSTTDYLKVDRYLVAGCARDSRRRAVLESLVMLGARLESRVIVEGVETDEDLAGVLWLGVDLVQGYLLGRPMPIPALAAAWEAA